MRLSPWPHSRLVEKYHFRGVWPSAEILCKGLYIGAELVIVGDVVSLLPAPSGAGSSSCSVIDVLEISSIKLRLTNLDTASDDDNDDGHPYNTAVHVLGKAYTKDRSRAIDPSPVDPTMSHLPAAIKGYGKWYHLHDPSRSWQVPFRRIAGRCYEAEAMRLWLASPNPTATATATATAAADDDGNDETTAATTTNDIVHPHLSILSQGLQRTRRHAAERDRRIPPDKRWFWADSRAEALDLATLNGYEVGGRDEDRAPRRWRKLIKVMEGVDVAGGGGGGGNDGKGGGGGDAALGRSGSVGLSEGEGRLRGYRMSGSLVRSALGVGDGGIGIGGGARAGSTTGMVADRRTAGDGSSTATTTTSKKRDRSLSFGVGSDRDTGMDQVDSDVDRFVNEFAQSMDGHGGKGDDDDDDDDDGGDDEERGAGTAWAMTGTAASKRQRTQVFVEI